MSDLSFILCCFVIGHPFALLTPTVLANASTADAINGLFDEADSWHSVSRAPGIPVQGTIMMTMAGPEPAIRKGAAGTAYRLPGEISAEAPINFCTLAKDPAASLSLSAAINIASNGPSNPGTPGRALSAGVRKLIP
jgi:hypothetical protein